MNDHIGPLKVQSLKEACVGRLEELILSGEFGIGERLPPERDFAAHIGVSRPVLHEALVDLSAKGLVRIVSRHGAFVNDYRNSGSMAILSSLLTHHEGRLDPAFTKSLIAMRLLVETETARLAALNRTEEQLRELRTIEADEEGAAAGTPERLTALDFAFHLSIAMASGNLVYPLMLNSFKAVYSSLTGEFFRERRGTQAVEAVRDFHARLVEAIGRRDAASAAATMDAMLRQGEAYLLGEL